MEGWSRKNMYRTFYILRQTGLLIKQSKKIIFVTVLFLIIGMLTLGSTYIVGQKLFQSSLSLKQKVNIHVFFKLDTAENDIKNTIETIKNIYGVKSAELITNEQAKEEFLQIFPQYKDMLESLKRNPLPYTANIELTELTDGDRITEIVKNLPTIDTVVFSGETAKKLDNLIKLIWMLFVAILVVVSAEFAFTTQSSISFLVDFRKTEIKILNLIGADKFFIELPFVLISVLFSFIAWLISLFFLFKINIWSNAIVKDLLPFATIVNNVNMLQVSLGVLILSLAVSIVGSFGPLRGKD